MKDTVTLLWWIALLTAAFGWCVRTWLGSLKEARTSEDTPTTKIRSAAQGYVELQGFVRPLDDGPLTSPMLGLEAVWWKYVVQDAHKKRVDEHASKKRFFLEDTTGRCLIDPAGAQLSGSTTRTWSSDQPGPPNPDEAASLKARRYICSETVLAPGTRVYVRGEFRTVRAGPQPLDLMREKLATWKADEKKRAILDVDRDGKLSDTELEATRRAAMLDARREAGTSVGTADVVCQPADGRPFVISNVRQHVHARAHRVGALHALVGAVVAGVALIGLIALALSGAT